MSFVIPNRAAPPKPTPKPGQVKVMRALYNYTAQNSDELSFEEGDLLYVLDMADPNWWKAKCADAVGLIPSNYVQESMESVDYPLHEAAKRGNIEFLKECLTNKVSVNGLDKAGCTALHWAAHGGHLSCVQELLADANCQVNVQNKLGDTPLHSAAWKNHPPVVEILLDKGARTDILNRDSKFALDLAKDPQTAALIHRAVNPIQASEDYSDEESD